MIRYWISGVPRLTWNCTENDCSNCVGDACSNYILQVSTKGEVPTEGAVSDLSPVSDCINGNTVKLTKTANGGFSVRDMAVFRIPGNEDS